MYIPTENQWTDRDSVLEAMRSYNFALLVTGTGGSLLATHLPFTVHQSGEDVVLHGHLARANPQASCLEDSEVMIVFSGPHAYISPRHYDRADSVPTWNYLAVHAYGRASVVDDRAEGFRHLQQLMADSEPGYEAHWAHVSERYKEGLYKGIVPFSVRVRRLEAVAKMSQNKTPAERSRIVADLLEAEDSAVREVGRFMQKDSGGHLP